MAELPPRCEYGSDCPHARLRERRVVESLDKYRKETFEKFDLCDGTLLKKRTIVQGDCSNDGPWEHSTVTEKRHYERREEKAPSRCATPAADRNITVVQIGPKPVVEEAKLHIVSPCQAPVHELKRREEMEAINITECLDVPVFPLCDYYPPRPTSQATHISEKTIGTVSPCKDSSPPLAPRRQSICVDERSLKTRTPSPRPGTKMSVRLMLEADVENYSSCPPPPPVPRQDPCNERGGPRKAPRDCPQEYRRQPIVRESFRTSSRSSESHYLREQLSCYRSRDPPRDSPLPLGDLPIPVQRESKPPRHSVYIKCPYEAKEPRCRLQEDTVVRETFERETFTRRLFPSTAV